MNRITKILSDGTYVFEYGRKNEELILQLAKYEDMYEALCAEQTKILADMDKLRLAGKTKTVTYKQLLANKLMVMNLLGRFGIYGL
jgi:hypothetical protein